MALDVHRFCLRYGARLWPGASQKKGCNPDERTPSPGFTILARKAPAPSRQCRDCRQKRGRSCQAKAGETPHAANAIESALHVQRALICAVALGRFQTRSSPRQLCIVRAPLEKALDRHVVNVPQLAKGIGFFGGIRSPRILASRNSCGLAH